MKLNNLKSIKMKKFLFIVVATFLMSASLLAQNVAKECVLIEAFTGYRCPACPAAAGGIAEMLKQGLSVAPLAFHCNYYSEEYATPETEARGSSFYKVEGYPTVVVDGLARPNVVGTAGQYLQSYNALKAEYDKRINIESPFTIELTYDYHSWNKCEAKAIVKKVGECAGNDVRVFIALTESHVPQNWGGWEELNAVVRDVVTSTAGAKLVGETSEITALFDVHQWKKENCELVAWVQNTGSNKEVYQAVKISIATEPAQYDLGISKIENVPSESCSGIIKPTLTIKNHGSETLTSALLKITDENNNDLGSYKWEGNLKQGAETAFDMPEIRFNTSYINVEATELNGSSDIEDKYTFDNNFKYFAGTPYQLPDDGKLIFQVKLAEYENFSIDIINMDKEELVKTITFTDSDIVKEEYILPEEGCYRIIFKNKEGNGAGKNSFWGIIDGKKKTVVSGKDGENEFTYQYVVELVYDSSVGVEDVVAENVEIYPNPTKSVLNVNAANLNKVTVFNSIGQVVYVANVNSDKHVINVESWSNGLYYINLETNDGVISSQKVIVNK